MLFWVFVRRNQEWTMKCIFGLKHMNYYFYMLYIYIYICLSYAFMFFAMTEMHGTDLHGTLKYFGDTEVWMFLQDVPSYKTSSLHWSYEKNPSKTDLWCIVSVDCFRWIMCVLCINYACVRFNCIRTSSKICISCQELHEKLTEALLACEGHHDADHWGSQRQALCYGHMWKG